jgi:hypothetical protein
MIGTLPESRRPYGTAQRDGPINPKVSLRFTLGYFRILPTGESRQSINKLSFPPYMSIDGLVLTPTPPRINLWRPTFCGLLVCCNPLPCAATDALFTQSANFAQAFSGGLWESWEIGAAWPCLLLVFQMPSIAQLGFRKLRTWQPSYLQPLCKVSTFPSGLRVLLSFFLSLNPLFTARRGSAPEFKNRLCCLWCDESENWLWTSAGEDARATAGQEAGATFHIARESRKATLFSTCKEKQRCIQSRRRKESSFRQAARCCTVWPARILLR